MVNTATLAVKIVSDSAAARRDIGATGDAVGKWGARADKVGRASGRVFAGGLLAAGAAAVKFGQQASDLAETQSKVNVIFGEEGAKALDKFASSAAENLGQSKQAALDAAATFGTMGKVGGLAGKDLANFSVDLTTLASDMASFGNTSPEEAVQALGSALRGEAEPIRKYGVLLDDMTLRTEAVRLGLIKTTKEGLTPQQKVLAAQSSIMKQTKDAQGDFARTSDGLANKQRILKAQMTDLSTEIGAKLLPIMVKLTSVGLKVVQWIDQNQRLVGVLVAAIGSLVAITFVVSKTIAAWTAITTVASAVQSLFTAKTVAQTGATVAATAAQRAFNLSMLANPVGLFVLAIVALVAALVIAYKKSETFRAIVHKVGDVGKRAFTAIWDAIKPVIKAVGEAIKWVAQRLPGAFSTMKDLVVGYLRLVTAPWRILFGVIGDVARFLKDRVPAAVQAVRQKIGEVKDFILSPFTRLKGIISDIIGFFDNLIDKVQAFIDKIDVIPDVDVPFVGRLAAAPGGTSSVSATASPTIINVTVQGSLVGVSEDGVAEKLLVGINRGRRSRGLPPL